MMLQAKLQPPPLSGDLLSRPRLAVQLDAGLTTTLTLVAAPASYGKTSLVAGWLAALPGAVNGGRSPSLPPFTCWLSLDAYDDDPNRFWQGVLAALQTAVPDLGSGMAVHLANAPLPPPPQLLSELLNELAVLAPPLVLVLDDYHHVAARAIHDGVRYLLEHAPPSCIWCSPLAPIHPWPWPACAREQLTELRADDLRFTAEEAVAFLHASSGLSLPQSQLHTLMARTEGWITGLRLTARSLREQRDPHDFIDGLGRSQRYVIDYLTEEVLKQQPAPLQAFLQQTSIMPRLAADLADALGLGRLPKRRCGSGRGTADCGAPGHD